jgi:acetyl esterase/lipase
MKIANKVQFLAILSVPSTSTRRGIKKPSDCAFPSMSENALAPCLDWKRVSFFAAVIEKSLEGVSPEEKPLFWRSPIEALSLKGVCTTFIATAECDPLRDEGEAYGHKLLQAGTKVTIRRYTGVPHPFMLMKGLEKSNLYNQDTCEALKRAHEL